MHLNCKISIILLHKTSFKTVFLPSEKMVSSEFHRNFSQSTKSVISYWPYDMIWPIPDVADKDSESPDGSVSSLSGRTNRQRTEFLKIRTKSGQRTESRQGKSGQTDIGQDFLRCLLETCIAKQNQNSFYVKETSCTQCIFNFIVQF